MRELPQAQIATYRDIPNDIPENSINKYFLFGTTIINTIIPSAGLINYFPKYLGLIEVN